jgi:hypothetical protein
LLIACFHAFLGHSQVITSANLTQADKTPTVRDWSAVRKTFVESEQRPSYAELSERFSIPISTIGNVAADQGWVVMRAKYLESVQLTSDAAQLITAAAKEDGGISNRFRGVVLTILQLLEEELAGFREIKSQATRFHRLQDASFISQNCGNALKAVGLGSLPKGLTDRMAEREGSNPAGWKQGIMVTVNNLLAPSARDDGKQLTKAPAEEVTVKSEG